ncbi:Opacity protein [Siphonobacter aquaeclarae]|uniref:Opacity protein n=1 Tax=Siphonobacter aquaeclarae TaxID=563176 RepID=A0A1G9SZQ0_9BACT|nr:Opacity protein [Siphonobacter aquaeclarae]
MYRPMLRRLTPLLFLILSSLSATVASAQVLHLKSHFGLKGGLTSGYTIRTPKEDYITKFNSGLHIGAFYRHRINKFVIQPEVVLTQRGGAVKTRTSLVRNSFYYATATPVVGYILTEGLTLEAGPEFAYALNGPSGNPKGPDNNIDYGYTAGIRYDFMDMLDKVSLGIRYSRGFNNVITSDPGAKYYNQAIQVSVIYNFYREK